MNGPSVSLIDDAATFYHALRNDMEQATRSIRLEMYILQEGELLQSFVDTMTRQAAAGVAVSLIYDCVGSHGLRDETLAPLANAGGRILPYHPINPRRMKGRFRFSTLFRRDHRKLAIIDDHIWYAGGMNIGEQFLPWRDVTLRGEGAPVVELVAGFERILEGSHSQSPRFRLPDADRPVVALDSRPSLGVYPVKRMYLGRIKKARRRIWIAQAYFVPRSRLRKALSKAARRGVDVRIVVPNHSDVRVADLAAWPPVTRLVKDGVKVFRFTGGMLHTKMALIDDALIVGTANLDSMSLYWNREVAVMTRLPEPVAEGERLFSAYEEEAYRVTITMVKEQPWNDRLLGWFLRFFRWIL